MGIHEETVERVAWQIVVLEPEQNEKGICVKWLLFRRYHMMEIGIVSEWSSRSSGLAKMIS